ncbi:MAG TPA: hypothetical protein VFC19_05660 [Candidatus Limnocylindrales bacterium]|nr:hypothetical protein [Candidatus Limnocylindrales bacterium]
MAGLITGLPVVCVTGLIVDESAVGGQPMRVASLALIFLTGK